MLRCERACRVVRQVAYLRERRVSIDKGAHGNTRQPGTQRVDAREIEREVCRGTDVQRAGGRGPVPARGVRVVVGPALSEAQARKSAIREAEAERRVGRDRAARGVVAGRIVVAVFYEI